MSGTTRLGSPARRSQTGQAGNPQLLLGSLKPEDIEANQ
jgi:hypothetical protein